MHEPGIRAPVRVAHVERAIERGRECAAALHQVGCVVQIPAGWRSRIERAGRDHQLGGEVKIRIALARKAAHGEDAMGFLDARAFVRANTGDKLRSLTLTQIVAGTEQHQRAAVAQRQRAEARCGDDTVDAVGADLEDVAFVVVGVEITAEMAVTQRQSRIGQTHRVFGACEQRLVVAAFNQRGPLRAAPREQRVQRCRGLGQQRADATSGRRRSALSAGNARGNSRITIRSFRPLWRTEYRRGHGGRVQIDVCNRRSQHSACGPDKHISGSKRAHPRHPFERGSSRSVDAAAALIRHE